MDSNIEIKKVDASYLVKVAFADWENMLPALKAGVELIGKNSLVPVDMWYWVDAKTGTSYVEFMCKVGK